MIDYTKPLLAYNSVGEVPATLVTVDDLFIRYRYLVQLEYSESIWFDESGTSSSHPDFRLKNVPEISPNMDDCSAGERIFQVNISVQVKAQNRKQAYRLVARQIADWDDDGFVSLGATSDSSIRVYECSDIPEEKEDIQNLVSDGTDPVKETINYREMGKTIAEVMNEYRTGIAARLLQKTFPNARRVSEWQKYSEIWMCFVRSGNEYYYATLTFYTNKATITYLRLMRQ